MRCRPFSPAAIALCAAAASLAAPAAAQDVEVDVELVLAVDVSWSMDLSEQAIQRDGYIAAFRSPEVQKAILEGGWGRVAVTYVEWAGSFTQSVVVPWTLIDSREAADGFAYRLSQEEPNRERRTSISAALDFSVSLFDDNGFAGLRRVIDLSGDGPNNQGRPVDEARDAAVARGATINGLPLMTSGEEGGAFSWGGIADLDAYYTACVTGGAGAFVIPVNDWSQFPEAIRRKLILELAGTWPKTAGGEAVIQVQAGEAPVDCRIGERMWQQRQERWNIPN
ncbi:DUF1194 domain-containing protein [Aureimonas altamirensis]|uniref:DUF1194 domain-containing protein n=1 Tax=Aureimonas altamirensis TaxID=370622 RepID=UPI0020371C72|nr:DUF1194 domain-containing protein [Aureimonas altamirensis]MCM2504540.1 DUF1194 domain-containing protein [Aureimonas altamirensis]